MPGADIRNINPEWLSKNFLCMMGCPVHTEAGRYVNLIAEGRYEEAYRVARAPNPFASICGRICAAPCEDVCRRGKLDQPIAIRALKRFVTERFGVESLIDVIKLQELFRTQIKPIDKKVAIVGAGPAGLSCAHDLALLGYQVTVFEKQQVPGGMLRLGVPEYRLPRELIRMEVNAILSLGINLELGKSLGHDFFLKDLRNAGFDAIFIAMGAHKSRILNIDGINADGILNAVDYLLKPIDKSRLEKAVQRARKQLESEVTSNQKIMSLLNMIAAPSPKRSKLLVKDKNRNILVDSDEVIFANVSDGIISLTTKDVTGETNYRTLEDLQADLDQGIFWRVNRSYLVNINKISEVIPWFNRTLQLKMGDRKQTEIPVSRSHSKRLKEYLKL